jgi:hypothetical protein
LGIASLTGQLKLLLLEITCREFPKLARDINNMIKDCIGEMQELGPPRQNERKQRKYLSYMARSLEDRARDALANYNAAPV